MNFRDLFTTRRRLEDHATSPYTEDLVHLLAARFGIAPGERGAYIGAATVRLAALFLDHGHSLTATASTPAGKIELERLKERFPRFEVVEGTPDTTNLPSGSFDFILSERVLHLPNPDAIRAEFQRLLRPGGVLVLITDNRVYGGAAQSEAFEDLLRTHCRDFREKRLPSNIAQAVQEFYCHGEVFEDAFVGRQTLSLESFLAQTTCIPIFPRPDDPAHDAIHDALHAFFKTWSVGGWITIPVVCRVAAGRLPQARSDGAEQNLRALTTA